MQTVQKNTAEYLISDNATYFAKDGKQIRKGTMAAAISNAEILCSSTSSADEKEVAISILKSIAPILNSIGLNKYLRWRNPGIQLIFDSIAPKDNIK